MQLFSTNQTPSLPSLESIQEVLMFLQELQLKFQLNKAEEVFLHARVDVAREVLEEIQQYAKEEASEEASVLS